MAAMICCEIEDIGLCLQTEDTLFSPQRVDRGTMAMISCLDCYYSALVIRKAPPLKKEPVSSPEILSVYFPAAASLSA